MKKYHLIRLILAAFFLAIALVLPLLAAQIKPLGKALLPMHLPILLCGLILGWRYGLFVGISAPILRSFLFGMPIFYPDAIAMAVELALYGCFCGLLYPKTEKYRFGGVYAALIPSMLIGRVGLGITKYILLSGSEQPYTFALFLSGAFLDAIPGIVLQLLLIPALMFILSKTKQLPTDKEK